MEVGRRPYLTPARTLLLALRRQSQEQSPVSPTCERLYAAPALPGPSLHAATLVPPEREGV